MAIIQSIQELVASPGEQNKVNGLVANTLGDAAAAPFIASWEPQADGSFVMLGAPAFLALVKYAAEH